MREQGKRSGVGQGSTWDEDEAREAISGHRMIGEPGMEKEEAEWEMFFHAAGEGLRGIERDLPFFYASLYNGIGSPKTQSYWPVGLLEPRRT